MKGSLFSELPIHPFSVKFTAQLKFSAERMYVEEFNLRGGNGGGNAQCYQHGGYSR